MRTPLALSVLVLSLLSSCGGSGISAEPLIGGDIAGSYDGTAFTPVNGFATVKNGQSLIVFSTSGIGCGSENATDPPRGYSATAQPSSLAVGTYSNVMVNLYRNVTSFTGVGSNTATVIITSSTAETVAGEVQFDYTNATNQHFLLTGTFEVANCAP